MTAGVAAAGAAAAAIANAVRAAGTIVVVEPDAFLSVLRRSPGALVVHATGGLFTTNYQYLTSYKGLAFFTKSDQLLSLPAGTETVAAKKIWIPS